MADFSRRGFIRTLMTSVVAAAASTTVGSEVHAVQRASGRIDGICVYVKRLEGVEERVRDMVTRAPGRWQLRPYGGELLDIYLDVRKLCCSLAQSTVNSVVGFSDPATFAIIREAVMDARAGFYYVTYETPHFLTFSVKV